jgi:hypothetical protein
LKDTKVDFTEQASADHGNADLDIMRRGHGIELFWNTFRGPW